MCTRWFGIAFSLFFCALLAPLAAAHAQNRPPIFEPIADFSVGQDQFVDIAILIRDPDGDAVTSEIFGLPEGAAYQFEELLWSPNTVAVGTYPLRIVATDGQLQSQITFTVTVNKVSQPPRFLNAPTSFNIFEDNPVRFSVAAYDSDLDPIQFSVSRAPLHGTLVLDYANPEASGNATAWYTYTPSPEFAGADSFNIKVSDAKDGSSETQPIAVTITELDDRAEFVGLAAHYDATEDQPIKIEFSLADVDSDVTGIDVNVFSNSTAIVPWVNRPVANGEPGYTLQANAARRTLTLVPFPNASGKASITLSFLSSGFMVQRTIDVDFLDVNDPPVVSALNEVNVWGNLPLNVEFGVGDFEEFAGPFRIELSSSNQSVLKDADLQLSGQRGQYRIALAQGIRDGTSTISVKAFDGPGLSTTQSFVTNFHSAMKGDANSDGVVSGADVDLMRDYMRLSPGRYRAELDVDDDGILDGYDYYRLQEFVAGRLALSIRQPLRFFEIDTQGSTADNLDYKQLGQLQELNAGAPSKSWSIQYEKKGVNRADLEPGLFNLTFPAGDAFSAITTALTGAGADGILNYAKIRINPATDAWEPLEGYANALAREYVCYKLFRQFGIPVLDVAGVGAFKIKSRESTINGYGATFTPYLMLQRDNSANDEVPFTRQFNMDSRIYEALQPMPGLTVTGDSFTFVSYNLYGNTVRLDLDLASAIRHFIALDMLAVEDRGPFKNEDYGRDLALDKWRTIPNDFDFSLMSFEQNRILAGQAIAALEALPPERKDEGRRLFYQIAREMFDNPQRLNDFLVTLDGYSLPMSRYAKHFVKARYISLALYFSSPEFAEALHQPHRLFDAIDYFVTEGERLLGSQYFTENLSAIERGPIETYVPRYRDAKKSLTIQIEGSGSVSAPSIQCVDPSCQYQLYNGATVTLTANPLAPATFQGWGGACSGDVPTCTLTINGTTNVVARFSVPLAVPGAPTMVILQ